MIMQVSYFPGCTLTNKAKGLNETAKESLKILGVELKELKDWYCCQSNFSLLTDNLMNHLAPVRTLVSARKEGDKLAVLCSTCYYVLKRVSCLMEKDEAKRKTVFDFLEAEYKGPIQIVHFLQILRDEIGFAKLKENIKVPLTDLAAAPYYGCQLLRPYKELAFDDPENPVIFEDFLNALGCKTIDYPFKTECCGAFLAISADAAVEDCVLRILRHAQMSQAEMIATCCPLCNFNLERSQDQIAAKNKEFKKMPVFYLTELLALSLAVNIPDKIWDEHLIDPRPFLERKGLKKASL